MVRLNEELRQALKAQPGQPVQLVDDHTGERYVLVRADLFEQMRAALEEDSSIREAYPLMDAVAHTEGWDDPEMDSYDIYRRPQP